MAEKETIQQKMSKAISDYYNEEKGNKVSIYSLETFGNIVIRISQAEINTVINEHNAEHKRIQEENEMLREDIKILRNRQAGEE